MNYYFCRHATVRGDAFLVLASLSGEVFLLYDMIFRDYDRACLPVL